MGKRIITYALLIAATTLLIPSSNIAYAHGGRTAADGCHNDRKAGTRHCHGTKSKPSKYVPRSSLKGTSSVYYPNCTAARNDGKSNIRRGQPGYGRHLDRDGDGVACE